MSEDKVKKVPFSHKFWHSWYLAEKYMVEIDLKKPMEREYSSDNGILEIFRCRHCGAKDAFLRSVDNSVVKKIDADYAELGVKTLKPENLLEEGSND